MSVKYIPFMPRRDAEALARQYALQDEQLWRRLRSLTNAEQTLLKEKGGLGGLPDAINQLQDTVAGEEFLKSYALDLDPIEWAKAIIAQGSPESYVPILEKLTDLKTTMLHPSEYQAQCRKELPAVQGIVAKLDHNPNGYSLDELINLWVTVNKPRETRKHRALIGVLRSVIGDIPYNEITQTHIVEFRKHVESTGVQRITQVSYLRWLKSMFAAALSENKIESNPVEGVKVHGKPNRRDRYERTFTGSEVRLILEKAAEIEWGFKRHEEVLWGLKLLAYTGARPREIFQLRKVDVAMEAGINFLHIRALHPEQSLKNDPRRVPLHPAVQGFVQFAKTRSTDFIFGAFPFNKVNGRHWWLTGHFSEFKKEVCGIDGERKTVYSLRHSFHDAMRAARVPLDVQHAITGHTPDEHSKYGRGSLKAMADEIARVDPLAD